MAGSSLTAPVGLSPRESQGKPVKNKAADVMLVRAMLSANGIGPMGESKKMDSGLLKSLKTFQKKIGFKNPDQVVDPGGKTEKALKPKFEAQKREAAKVVMVEVKYRGKILQLTEKDHEKMVKEVFAKLDGYMTSLIKNHKSCIDTHQDYLDTAMLKDGVMNAVAQAIIITAGSVNMPDMKIISRSIKATGGLERAIASKDLTKLDKALPEAEAAINAFNAEIQRFLKDFTGSAQTTATVLTITSATCFAVVGALAAPVLVTGAGMSATAAAVTSGASVGVLQSASQELGKHASGMKVTVWGSVQSIVIDGTIGGLTAGIGNKIPLKFCDKMGKAMASKLGSKVAFMSSAQLEKFIANYLAGSGQEVIKGAIGESIKLVGIWMKKGKIPSEKDFDAAVESVLYSALLGGMVKNLGGFQKKWAYKNKDMLTGTILPDRFSKLAKSNTIPKTLQAKLWADVMNKVSNEGLKAGHHEIYARATGKESEKQLTDMAAKAMLKDKSLQKIIDREMLKAMKKHGIEAK
ncbi:hypothetical protein FEE96_01305 [Parasedimentitalea maritima]|uniref:Peptidoglycan binding-like domain-containing protein n=1 Tax=Parasedimentitalea maritima TaxID=2578117 RepID=A0ABY2V3T2_9RHOB|nr:hypothetical protein [Zongyanglinia marina]TLP68953.1 hypothetical protein FEE96_01305 [Zongyanglinia marina]